MERDLSYLYVETPNQKQCIGPPIKMAPLEEKEAKKDWQNIYLRIKNNQHAFNLKASPYQVVDDETLVAQLHKDLLNSKLQQYKFTKIFGPEIVQQDLFHSVCMKSMNAFIQGDNCLLFAYGATNSGKTYTIQGNVNNPGLIPRVINVLFNTIKGKISHHCKYKPDKVLDVKWLDEKAQQEEINYKKMLLNFNLDKSNCSRLHSSKSTLSQFSEDSLDSASTSTNEYVSCVFRDMQKCLNDSTAADEDGENIVCSVWVSYTEIHNECIYDLLEIPDRTRKRHQLSLGETVQKDVYIKGLRQICVYSGDEAFQVFQFGQHNLRMAPTSANHTSSRSHGIFSIKLVRYINVENPTFARVSTFSLVDLAGAERAKRTDNVGERMKESQCINTSLHVLGKCLEAIRHNQKPGEKKMIPFRESKLTRLFQRALCGKDKITMIVTVNLDASLHDETVNVLKFSAVAKEIVFNSIKKPKPCALRLSRFSLFMGKHHSRSAWGISSNTFSTLHESESSVDARCEELLSVVDLLEKQVSELKEKNTRIETEVRLELNKKFSEMLVKMEDSHQKNLEESAYRLGKLADWRINKLHSYYENQRKRHRCEEKDEEISGESVQQVREELEAKNNILRSQLDAAIELLQNTKESCQELQTRNSKLQFEMADLQNELQSSKKLIEVFKCRPNEKDSSEKDPVIDELQSQIEDLRKLLNKKDEELQESRSLVNEAHADYELHFREHEDLDDKARHFEQIIASKDEEIDELKSKLEVLQVKLIQQAESLKALEEREYQANDRQALCEARDEYKFLASKFENLYKQATKEIENLKGATLEKSVGNDEIRVLEIHIQSLQDELKVSKEKLVAAKNEISQLKQGSKENIENQSSALSAQDLLEKEVIVLQKEIKELIQNKKELNDALSQKTKECESHMQEMKVLETSLEQEQQNTKELQKNLVAEIDRLKVAAACDTIHSQNTLDQELEKKISECKQLEEQNQKLYEKIKIQETEMENLKMHHDVQLKQLEDLLKIKQDEVDMQKQEVQQYRDLFVKAPNKNHHTDVVKVKTEPDESEKPQVQVLQLTNDMENLGLKVPVKNEVVKVKYQRSTRSRKVQDENDPIIDNKISQAGDEPLEKIKEETPEIKTRSRRKKLYNIAETENTSPLHPKRTTRRRRL